MVKINKETIKYYQNIAKEIKQFILNVAYQSQAHHLGSFFSAIDLLTVLYFRNLKINLKKLKDHNRDRFILSKGHAGLAFYSVLAKRGFFSEKELINNYGRDGGKLGVHPDKDALSGIEVTTGSLGHGLSIGAGLALAAKIDKLTYRTFVMLGDGECNEGSIWEAIMFSSQHKLDNLVVILDYNHLQGFGRTEEVINLSPMADKWQVFGWQVKQIDGHNFKEIISAFDAIPFKKNKPSVIIANTIKGKGISFLEDKLESHYKKINKEELEIALKELK